MVQIRRRARDSSHVEILNQRNLLLRAADACRNNGGTCVQKDDTNTLMEKVLASDGIVFGSTMDLIPGKAEAFMKKFGVEGVRCVGFENKGKYEKSLVFVYVNATDSAQTTALKYAKGWQVYTTDETHDLALTAEGGGDVTVDLPAQSVVTVVVG